MKILLFFALTIIYSLPLQAQDELMVLAGQAIPTGSFGTSTGGAADMGFIGGLMYQHQSSPTAKTRLGILARYQSNPMNETDNSTLPPGATLTTTNWTAFSILLGPVFNIKVSDRSALQPRFMIGYMSATSPDMALSYSGGSASVSSSRAGALTISVGINLKINMSEKMGIVLGGDLTSGTPKFSPQTSGLYTIIHANEQSVSTLNLTGGLFFKL